MSIFWWNSVQVCLSGNMEVRWESWTLLKLIVKASRHSRMIIQVKLRPSSREQKKHSCTDTWYAMQLMTLTMLTSCESETRSQTYGSCIRVISIFQSNYKWWHLHYGIQKIYSDSTLCIVINNVQDYEPSGTTPIRSEQDVPSMGTIESLRAMPMEALVEEFRENNSYESFEPKELKPSLIPRSPLSQIN